MDETSKPNDELFQRLKQSADKALSNACPNCGYCPHCGRGGYHAYPVYPMYPAPYPTWPAQPWITWTVTGTTIGNTTLTS